MIKPETEIVLRGQISLEFVKKQNYFGSWRGMRYRLSKKEDALEAAIYPGPFCWEATADEKKEYKEFAFSEAGLDEAVAWLNESYESREWTL